MDDWADWTCLDYMKYFPCGIGYELFTDWRLKTFDENDAESVTDYLHSWIGDYELTVEEIDELRNWIRSYFNTENPAFWMFCDSYHQLARDIAKTLNGD